MSLISIIKFFFLSSLSDQKLVPEPEDEAEEERAGCSGSRLSGQHGFSLPVLPWAAGLPGRALHPVPHCSRWDPCLLPSSSQPSVHVPSAQHLRFVPGLLLPRSHAASGQRSVPDLPSVLLMVLLSSSQFVRTRWFMVGAWRPGPETGWCAISGSVCADWRVCIYCEHLW